jgi:hypothetical protein
MKQNWKTTRFTLIEVVPCVAMVAVALMTFFAMVAPQSRHRTNAIRISSGNSLKQVFCAPSYGVVGKNLKTPLPDR